MNEVFSKFKGMLETGNIREVLIAFLEKKIQIISNASLLKFVGEVLPIFSMGRIPKTGTVFRSCGGWLSFLKRDGNPNILGLSDAP